MYGILFSIPLLKLETSSFVGADDSHFHLPLLLEFLQFLQRSEDPIRATQQMLCVFSVTFLRETSVYALTVVQ